MSRRARTRHDKRKVALNSVQIAIEGAALLDAQDRAALQSLTKRALLDLQCGRECAGNWASLADALNVAETLSFSGICSDAGSRGMIERAQAALAAVWQRHAAGGSWTLRGSEIQSLDDGVLVVRVQLDHCSVREYLGAVETTKRKMQAVRAGNGPRGAIVLGSL